MPSVSNPLQQAVFRGCVECIRMLVESPPYYNVDASCGPEGLRPIHIAAREGHIQTLRFLKSAGACIQKSDVNGASALHHAAITGQLRAVRWLLRHGAKISLDNQGRSPIHVAAKHDHMEIVSVLSKHATSGKEPVTSSLTGTHSGSNGALKEAHSSVPVSVSLDQFSTANANGGSHHNGREKSRERSKERSRERSGSTGTSIAVNANGGSIIKTTVNATREHHKSKSDDSKLFSQNPPPPPPPPGTDCASSSGNSSLSASTNTPSLSPSASSTSNSSTTSCGCPVSSSDSSSEELKSATETTHSFTLTDFRTKSPDGAKKDSTSFYLHPPKANGSSNGSSPALPFSCPQSPVTPNGKVNGAGTGSPANTQGPVTTTNGVTNGKKFQHSRQPSTCVNSNPGNSPFFLHPPENLVNETRAVASKMAPAPVNPSHGHHHIQDLINDTHSQSKMKNGMGMSASDFSSNSSSSVSSGSSPPPTPPSNKTFGIGCTVSALQGKFQQISANGSNNKDESAGLSNNSHNFEVLQNSINAGNGAGGQKNGVPPPPPPPPMPGFAMDLNNNLIGSNENGPHEPDKKSSNGDGTLVENDYEDIEELTSGENHFEHMAKKLVRTSSCPPPPPPLCDLTLNGNANSDEKSQITPTKPPPGGGKGGVPFIPPHFPTPPQDALIKPSEYLRSIQNKGKTNGATNGTNNGSAQNGNPATPNGRPLSKVEEAIKALGVADLAVMSPVPEETNAEDEFEEINPERINGSALASAPLTNGSANIGNGTNGTVSSSNGVAPEKPSGKENEHQQREPIYASPSALGFGKSCGAVIKPEELMKVHLKKTPMSRTRSAPPLGRVVPDNQPLPLTPTGNLKNGKSNGELLLMNEPLRRSNTALNGSTSNLSTCGEPTTKAAVIAELAESSQVGGVREWKEELRRRQLEEEKAVQKDMNQYYQPVNFFEEVPSTDMTGAPIPAWKRQMMAKKAAERARKEAEEQRKLEIEQKRMAAIPLWRRQLLQRRESASDGGKYAQ